MEFEQLQADGSKVPAPLTQTQMQASFQPMQFASSSIVLPESSYRVYTGAKEFKEVEASSAYEAMQKTGIKSPLKIERHSLSRVAVLTEEMIGRTAVAPTEAAPAAVEQAEAEVSVEAAPEAAAEVALPTEEDAASRGLEGDELDALLIDKEG